MTEQISIVRKAFSWVVENGKASHARLWFYAPGLEIFVRGEDASRSFPIIANIACNAVLERHIPINSMRTVAITNKKSTGDKPDADGKHQLTLFENDDTTGAGDDK